MTDAQFERLMQVLGQVGSQAYEAAYRQAMIDAIWSTVVSLVFMGAIVACLLYGKHIYTKPPIKDRYGDDKADFDKPLIYGGLTIIIILCGLVVMVTSASALTGFFNPQWYAIKHLADLVK